MKKNFPKKHSIALLLAATCFTPSWSQTSEVNDDHAMSSEQEDTPAFGFHGQATYIWQRKPSFNAVYSGPNSLITNREKSYSFTTTADLGSRLWQGNT